MKKKVLNTKVCRPKLVGSYLRKRLFKNLDDHKDFPLTWISGPAGCGKTTLASTYAESNSLDCIWYQIDAGDNDFATFIYYLRQAIANHLSQDHKILGLFTPEYIFGAEVFVRRYFEEIGHLIKPPAILVFDNYQLIPAESVHHKLFINGISRLPSGLRVLVLSRSSPPPAFARMKANGRMGSLTWEDLRLDFDETCSIIDLKAKKPVSDQIKNEIHAKSDGWAAGLSLIWQSKTLRQIDHEMTASTPSEIFDYFAEEIFNTLNEETQQFLIKSSTLADMKVADVIALTAIEAAEDILHTLQKFNYFISQPDKLGHTYRYHPLFREFLQAKAKLLLNPNEFVLMRKTAGNLLEQSGNIEEAISLYFSIEDFHSAISIIMHNAPALLSQGRNTILLQWIACIPDSLLSVSPWLNYWKGAASLALDPLHSYRIFNRAYGLAIETNDVQCKLLSISGMLDSTFYSGEGFTAFDQWLDMYDSLEAEIEACSDQGIKMRVMGSFITAFVVRRPHYSKVQIWGERFLFDETSSQNAEIIASILCHVAWYYCCYRGYFNKAKLIFQRINQIVTGYPLPPLQKLNMKMIEASMYAIFGDTKQCSQIVSDALAFSKKSGVILLDFMLIGHEIANALNRNDVPKAIKLLKILENWHGPMRLWDKSFFHFLKARTLLLSKDFQEASLHAQISVDLEEQVGSAIGRSLSRMLFVQILFEQGKKTKAKILIEDLLKLSEDFRSESLSLYVLFIKAQFALSDGEAGIASECLHRAAQLAKSTGMVNTYVDQPEATADLCVFALKHQIEVEYYTHVIRFRQLVPSNPPVDLDNWPWPIKIHTLGNFRIYRDGNAIEFVRKVQQMPLKLLKLMIALGGTGIPEEQLADILWPDTDGYSAYRAFSTTLYRLRQLLEIPDLIKVTEGKVSIDKRLCWVDSWAFEKITNEILGSRELEVTPCNRSEIEKKLEKALIFYRGDFLKIEEWGAPVISEREKLRSLFIQLIDKIGRFLEAKELWHDAIQLYKRGLAINESIEKFYQRLMICHFNLGEKSDAMSVFERCRKILSAGYGIEPGNKLNEIRSMIMRR